MLRGQWPRTRRGTGSSGSRCDRPSRHALSTEHNDIVIGAGKGQGSIDTPLMFVVFSENMAPCKFFAAVESRDKLCVSLSCLSISK